MGICLTWGVPRILWGVFLKKAACYFGEDGVDPCRERVVLLRKELHGSLKLKENGVYVEDCGVVLKKVWCGAFKRVMCYFENGDVVIQMWKFVL